MSHNSSERGCQPLAGRVVEAGPPANKLVAWGATYSAFAHLLAMEQAQAAAAAASSRSRGGGGGGAGGGVGAGPRSGGGGGCCD